ncbi:MAG: TCR/Tet family MFS transporter [Oscillochloris sp.]|nr:TCR/Tet family MFS transporter [Oscillochloris sp.]
MKNRRASLGFIFLTVFIDLLGAGMILPLLPFYVKLIEQADSLWLTNNLALIVGLLTASFSLFQFLFTPILGAISDRVGRRPVLIISLAGTGVAYVLLGFADQLISLGVGAFLGMLFFARILDGITGGNISTAQAYIADVTPPEERARGLGMIGAAFGLGFMLGPAFGGLLSTISLSAPAYVAAALAFANVLFGIFVLPESLPAERRTARVPGAPNPFARLGGLFGRRSIRSLLIGIMLLNLAFAGLQSNFAVFSAERFNFGPTENAFIFAFIGLIAVLVQGVFIRRLVARFGEARLAMTGLALMTLSFVLIAFLPFAAGLYLATGILAAGSGLATPSLTSLISRRVGEHEQGSVLGGVQAMNSLMMVAGPLLAGVLFDAIAPVAPYIVGSVLIGGAGILVTSVLQPVLRTAPTFSQPLGAAVEFESARRSE